MIGEQLLLNGLIHSPVAVEIGEQVRQIELACIKSGKIARVEHFLEQGDVLPI